MTQFVRLKSSSDTALKCSFINFGGLNMGIFHLFSRLICSTVKIKYLILGYIFPDLLSVFVLKVFHLVLAFATFQIKRKKAESWSVSEFQSNLLNRAAISSGRSCSLNLIRVRVTWQLLFRSTVFRKFFRAPVHTSHHHCYEYSQYIKCNVIHHCDIVGLSLTILCITWSLHVTS